MSAGAYRTVVEGRAPSPHASVRRALDLLHGPADRLEAVVETLAAGLAGRREDVEIDRAYRLMYATDASIYEMEPVAVVFPRSAADVQHVVRVAAARGIPVLPRGGGTSLAGQGVNHAIVLDFTRHMSRVLSIDAGARVARVEPGVVLDALTRAARPHGLLYPIDPSTKNRATIGGGIGNNSCGAHSVIYGKTLDQVVSLTAVLADGSLATFEAVDADTLAERLGAPTLEGDAYRAVRRLAREHRDEIAARYPRIQRRVSGYNLDEFIDDEGFDLARLLVGSEGTLAAVVEATVRLVPLPAAKGVAAVHFRSVPDACRATMTALEHGPSAVELVDETIIRRCRESIGYAGLVEFVEGDPGALLLVECYGETGSEIEGRLAALCRDLTTRAGAYASVTTVDPGEQLRWWRMREAGLGILMSVKGDAKPIAFVEDTAAPPEQLGEFVERFDALVRRHGTSAAYYGHASVGCLHIRPLVNIREGAGLEQIKAIASEVADLVLEYGGSLSGEHGDGILRGVFTERMFGPTLTQAFRDLKRAFDPQGIFNPGKIVDTPAFDDNLRLAPWTRSLQPPTRLDWSGWDGMRGAAEQCNGQGACRKDEGSMCPSFMVTGDEEHSTRGRANLLREILNGATAPEELTGDRLHAALDLCVECKACKSECPSGVDLAKLKYEVLSLRHDQHGTPLRDRLFGHIVTVSRWGSRLGPLIPVANAIMRWEPVRYALHATIRIHRDRPLPRLARRRFRPRHTARGVAPRGPAVLFDDTFTRYYHPEVGEAAERVLSALGYEVVVLTGLGCCGRPLISKGQLGEAERWARTNVERLAPYARRGVPVVGTEPSCLLTLRDEYPELVPGEDSTAVAGQALLLDELVARLAAEDPSVRERFSARNGRALLHAHCHQKALAGAAPSLAALGLIAGLDVSLVDSACCGMAGSFGFEAEHYDVSRAMGERGLFPAVEAAGGETPVLITGVSCRQQIEHFTGREPRHVAEVLAEALITD